MQDSISATLQASPHSERPPFELCQQI